MKILVLCLLLPFSLQAQSPCPDSARLAGTLSEFWEVAQRLTDVDEDSTLLLCQKIDSLAILCPEQFADYLVAASALASTKMNTYPQWAAHLEKSEQLLAQYEPFLHWEFELRTKILTAYERCRYTDSRGDMEGALDCYRQVWEKLPAVHPDTILEKFRYALSNSIAWLYHGTGNYKGASNWLHKSWMHIDTNHYLYSAVFYNVKGKISQSLGNVAEAKQNYRQAEQEFFKTEPARNSNHFFENYINLANLFLTQSLPDSALTVLNRAQTHAVRQARSNLYLHYQFAIVYLALDSLPKVLVHSRLARQYAEIIKPGPYFWKGRIAAVVGEAMARQTDWKKALDTLQVALQHLSSGFLEPGWDRNPAPRSSDRKLDLLKLLVLKARTLESWYEMDPHADRQLLEWSLSTALATVDLVRILRAEYGDDEVKQYLSSRFFSIFEQAIGTSVRLYDLTGKEVYLEQAFACSETSKSLSLLENLRDLDAKTFANLPDSLIQKENRLKIQMARLERSISEQQREGRQQELREVLFDVREEYGKLLAVLEHSYPDYFRLKYDWRTIAVSTLQRELEPDEMLVEYFFGERVVFTFFITRTGAGIRSFPVTEGFHDDLDEFLKAVSRRTGLNTQKRITGYQQVGFRIFKQLLDSLPNLPAKLIIIPDGRLNYLPFAALPMDTVLQNDPGKLPYLLRKYTLRNNFSASVHFLQQKEDRTPQEPKSNSLLVLSPKEFPNDSRLSLDSTSLTQFFQGQVRIVRDPDKEQVRQLLNEGFPYIFIFTHASASEKDPFLQLYGDTLFLHELYATPVRSDMVLLGACETGLGENLRGEGVLSLARGFAYQNVANTVMTLWKVQDGAALKISLDFLRLYLQEHKSPSEALQQAQLNFLDDPAQIGFPFLWAGFVGVGE